MKRRFNNKHELFGIQPYPLKYIMGKKKIVRCRENGPEIEEIRERGSKNKEDNNTRRQKIEIGLFEKLIFRIVHIFNTVYLEVKLKRNCLKNDKWGA